MAPAIAGESPVNSLLLVPDSTRLPPLARYQVDISIQIARRVSSTLASQSTRTDAFAERPLSTVNREDYHEHIP